MSWPNTLEPNDICLVFGVDRDDTITVKKHALSESQVHVSYEQRNHMMTREELKKSRQKIDVLQKWHESVIRRLRTIEPDNFWENNSGDEDEESNAVAGVIENNNDLDHDSNLDKDEDSSSDVEIIEQEIPMVDLDDDLTGKEEPNEIHGEEFVYDNSIFNHASKMIDGNNSTVNVLDQVGLAQLDLSNYNQYLSVGSVHPWGDPTMPSTPSSLDLLFPREPRMNTPMPSTSSPLAQLSPRETRMNIPNSLDQMFPRETRTVPSMRSTLNLWEQLARSKRKNKK